MLFKKKSKKQPINDTRTYDEIIAEITAGLTGDNKADLKYLTDIGKQYTDHPLGLEITRAIGRMIAGIVKEEGIGDELFQHFDNMNKGKEALLEEVQFLMYKGEFTQALEIVEKMVKEAEELNMYADDKVNEYHDFWEPMEEILYNYIYKPEKEIRPAPTSQYARMYLLYGTILVEFGRYDEAREILAKARKWNPTNSSIAFEYIETFKIQGRLQEAFDLTIESFKYMFKPLDLARAYRNLGYILIEMESYKEAYACYLLSMSYEPNQAKTAQEILYIQDKAGKIDTPTNEEMELMSKNIGFPVGPDHDVLGICYTLGRDAINNEAYPMAAYFLGIFYELTEDEEVRAILESLPTE